MDIQHYKQRLLDLEKDLAARIRRAREQGRGDLVDGAGDAADVSVADEMRAERFSDAEHNSAVLQQVRDALGRVVDGTYGHCIVDGAAIEERRLEAEPWTPYCLAHARRVEAAESSRTPTL